MNDPASARGDSRVQLPDDCRTETLGVAFFDLSRIAQWASSEDDALVATFLQRFYELAAEVLEPAGARIVKFIGDAGLVVFPTESAEAAIGALGVFMTQARDLGRQFGFDTYLNVNVHAGPVIAGTFGPAGHERFDVIGKTVNIAARLGRRGLKLSAQAFRCLGPEARQRFQKVTQPTTYQFRG